MHYLYSSAARRQKQPSWVVCKISCPENIQSDYRLISGEVYKGGFNISNFVDLILNKWSAFFLLMLNRFSHLLRKARFRINLIGCSFNLPVFCSILKS